MRKRLPKMLAAFAIAASMVLTACGGGGESESSSESSTSEASSEASSESESASAESSSSESSETASSDDPIYIGWVGPLTGSLAYTGNQTHNACELACETVGEVLGRPVEMLSGDAVDAASAVSEFERLYEEGCRLFIGSYGSFADYAIQALVDEYDCMLITASGWADDFTEKGYENYFMFTPRVKMIAEGAAEAIPEYAEQAGIAKEDIRIALFGSASYEYVMNDTREALEAAGLNIVVDECYAADRSDFTSLISSFQANDVNVLVPAAQGSSDGPVFLKQMAELGYSAPLGFSMGLFYDQSDFAELGTELTDGWMVIGYTHTFINPDSATGVTEFRTAFEEAYGNTPLTHATQTYSATLFVLDMIEAAGTDDVDAVIEQMRAADVPVGTYPSYWGVHFDENGNNLGAGDPPCIGQWQNGECVVVGADELQVADAILPMG